MTIGATGNVLGVAMVNGKVYCGDMNNATNTETTPLRSVLSALRTGARSSCQIKIATGLPLSDVRVCLEALDTYRQVRRVRGAITKWALR